MGVNSQKPGFEDSFYNNTCVINATNPAYATFSNDGVEGGANPTMGYNLVVTIDGKATESGREIEEWQKEGVDVGTVVRIWEGEKDEDMIIDMAKEYLGMK